MRDYPHFLVFPILVLPIFLLFLVLEETTYPHFLVFPVLAETISRRYQVLEVMIFLHFLVSLMTRAEGFLLYREMIP
jgi:hypothetical protein